MYEKDGVVYVEGMEEVFMGVLLQHYPNKYKKIARREGYNPVIVQQREEFERLKEERFKEEERQKREEEKKERFQQYKREWYTKNRERILEKRRKHRIVRRNIPFLSNTLEYRRMYYQIAEKKVKTDE